MASLFSESVTLWSREVSGRDDYGNDLFDWVGTESPAWVEQRNGSEQQGPTEQSVANAWIYLPLSAPVSSTSRVSWGGREWEIDGEPGVQPGGFVVDGYQLAAMRKVTG